MRQRNHAPRFEEIAKMKLQAFRPSNPKSLQSQTALRSKNRLPLNGLEGVHGRLTNQSGPVNTFSRRLFRGWTKQQLAEILLQFDQLPKTHFWPIQTRRVVLAK